METGSESTVAETIGTHFEVVNSRLRTRISHVHPDMWWRMELPIKVLVNSCQEIDWEFELIVTFPHAGTTANLPFFNTHKMVVRNITEVN